MPNKDLAGLDDRELLDIVRVTPQASARRTVACELLVSRHQSLVRSCVRRYLSSPEPAEDLMQVGYVGLLKAIGNFDPAAGCSLATYARPCISGELKRHFRDKRWQVRVKRPVQELVLEVRKATWRLAQELGRTPAESDMTRHLGVSGDDLRQARRAELAFWPYSLDAPAVLFIIAFLINATSTATSAVFSPMSLLLAGLACLALHLAGVGTKWSVPRRKTRR
jgi:RNA polymerase sigma factor (sigma-70 family)